jgi:hypothetical protein
MQHMRVKMSKQSSSADAEFDAIQVIYQALEPLEDDARSRVLRYIAARLDIFDLARTRSKSDPQTGGFDEETASENERIQASKYDSLAELADATQPVTNADRALVAAYWLQVCQGADSFDGFSANKELKQLGHGVVNITMALDALRKQKPSLVLQLKKSGRSQQARKTYKLTIAGIKSVENMTKKIDE